MRAFLAVLLLAVAARAETGDLAPLREDVRSYLDAEAVERKWGYDRYEVAARWFAEVRAGAWWPAVEFSVSVGGLEILDLTSELNVEDERASPLGRVTVGYDVFEVIFDYTQLGLAGNVVIDETFTIDGETFQINETLAVDFTFRQFRIVPGFRVYRSPGVTVWLLAALGLQHLEGELTSTGDRRVGVDELLPIPLFGLSVKGRVGRVVWDVEILTLYLDQSVFGAQVLDLRAGVAYSFSRTIALRLGYRYAKIEGYYEILAANLNAQGLVVTAVFEF